jgi:hypothetical protein
MRNGTPTLANIQQQRAVSLISSSMSENTRMSYTTALNHFSNFHEISVFLHIGGNNIVNIVNTNVCNIIRQLKFEIRYIFENFQSAIIVWVFILPRLSWLWQGKGSDLACMNRKRQRVNRSISQFMLTQPNGRSLHIKSIDKDTPGFFRADNVHLSDIGNEMFILAVSEAVSLFLNNESDTSQKYLEV